MSMTIAEYYALKPSNYGPVVRLTYSQAQPEETAMVQHSLELVLSRFPSLSEDRLVLCFVGVSDLQFSQPLWSLATFGLIELHECDSGFRATEEEGLISFRFKSIEARLENAQSDRNSSRQPRDCPR